MEENKLYENSDNKFEKSNNYNINDTNDTNDIKKIYCRNCGKNGHLYKMCFKPIISLGIICVNYDKNINNIIKFNRNNGHIYNKYNLQKIDHNIKLKNIIANKLKFLMICRKYSHCFIDFIRGNYSLNDLMDIEYIKTLFKYITKNEYELILTKTFDEIWNDIWIDTTNYKKEYFNSKQKYTKLFKGFWIIINNFNETKRYFFDINYFLVLAKNTLWDEPEWEFPKGRRNFKESDLICSIREFEEETNFKNENYEIINNANQISEIFMGENNINYKYSYYLAQSSNTNIPVLTVNGNISQKTEISNICWLSYHDALYKIREYNNERKELLHKVFNYLYFNISLFEKYNM